MSQITTIIIIIIIIITIIVIIIIIIIINNNNNIIIIIIFFIIIIIYYYYCYYYYYYKFLTPKSQLISYGHTEKPDDASVNPWKRRKPLAWDVTVLDTHAASDISETAENAGATATRQQAIQSQNTTALPQRITSSRSR